MKPNEELLQKIGQVRTKWKTLLWVRGLAWVLGVLVASIAVGLYLASTPKVPFWLLNALKLAGVAALVTAVVRTLVMPLRRVPTDEQLARFVQEKNPGLEDRLVSAVEAIHKPRPDQGMFSFLVVKDALDRTRNVKFAEQINKRHITTFALSTGVLALLLLGGLYLSTLYLPYGFARLTANVLKAPAVDKMSIVLKPGDVTVPKGEDVTIDAILSGFDPERADINLRFENSSNWEVSSMQVVPDKEPTYRYRIFNIQDPVHYFVTAGGRKSDEYTIKVADLPKLEKMDYTYHFPAYTKMVDKHEENGFDMVALKGTTVAVIAYGSKPLSGGQIVFADGKNIPLKLSSTNPKQVMASVVIDRTTTFKVELTDSNRQTYRGLEVYNMEALEDQKPIIKFTKPGRDVPATNLEEVFTEVRAEDDFGVNTLDIYYSVNGKAEKKIEVFKNSGEAPRDISGGHTFFMEEFGVKPGDFVSYYAKATDTKDPANTATSDMYFIEVRPFSREFTQSQAGGQRGGGGGGGQRGQQDDSAQALVKRQKDILNATFNVSRDKDKFAPKEYADNLHAIAEGQSKLAVDVQNVVRRLEARQLTDDKQVKDITDYFRKATDQMAPAADQLNKEKPETARDFESTALQYLSNAAALYTQIQVQQGGGGGGGGGGGARSAQDLADLFALELDTSKNQYEQVQRGQASGGQQDQQAQQEVDELAKKLADLAKRQEAAARQRAAQAGQGGGGAADQAAQRDLLREAQALQRQLQKLTRDTQDPKVAEASKNLDQAIQNMQQAMAGGTPQQQQQAAQQAANAIQNTSRALGQTQNQNGSNNPNGNLGQQAQQLQNLQNEQKQLLDETLKQAQAPDSPQRQQALQSLSQRERNLEDKTRTAQQDLQNAGRNTQNPQAASAARAAANSLGTNRVGDRMQAAANGLEANNPKGSAIREQEAADYLGETAKQLGQASAAVNNSPQRQLQAALNSTTDAQRQLNALQRRMQEAQGQQPGQSQQPGQQQGQGQQPGQQQGQGQGQGQQPGQQQGQGQQPGQQQGRGQGQGQQPGQQQGQGQGQGQQPGQQQGQGQGQGQQPGQQPGQGQGQGQQPGQQQGRGQGQGQQPGQQQGQGQGQGQQPGQQQGQGQGQGNQQGGPGGNRQQGGNNGGAYQGNQFTGNDIQNPRQVAGEIGNITQTLQNALDQLGRNNPAAPALNEAITAVSGAQSQALKGVILDPAEITKLKEVLGNAEVAVSRQLEVLVAKENARSPQEDSFPEGYVKQNAEYFKSLANQSPKQ